jgi:cathepsin L
MNKAILVAALFAVAVQALAPLPDEQYQFLFTKWASQHKKAYHHDDFFARYNVFRANLDHIRAHNAGNHTYTLGMNQFGDITPTEFKKFLGYTPRDRPPHSPAQGLSALRADLPTSVDWRTKNAVTPVKDPAQCGSSWAFSTTGSIEGAWAIGKGQLVSVSEQQLVDCSGAQGDQGCNGGLMDNAFQYVISNGGLGSEASYPYTAMDGTCKSVASVVQIADFHDVTSMDEDALLAAVAKGPVSVAIEADQQVFQFYTGGILDDSSCGTQLDHGVLAVGYGTDSGVNYWWVKNSWASSWGDHGYLRIVRGKNMCGINTDPSYPCLVKGCGL